MVRWATSGTKSSTQIANTLAVPAESNAWPGSTTPAPSDAAVWSPAPSATGVPAGIPVAASPAGLTVPTTSSGSTIRGRTRSSTPNASSSSADQAARRVSARLEVQVGAVDEDLAGGQVAEPS